jgi:hypothetical protein
MTSDSWAQENRFDSSVSHTIRSFRSRIVATLLGTTAWISFTLLYIGFWAHGFSLFQNVIVVATSLILLFGIVVALWVSFGLGMARRWMDW